MIGTISRRSVLQSALAAGAAALLPGVRPSAAEEELAATLTAGPASIPLVGGEWPETGVWAYNGLVPGPEIRVRQGDLVRVLARNGLDQPTTIHWHGLRLPNV